MNKPRSRVVKSRGISDEESQPPRAASAVFERLKHELLQSRLVRADRAEAHNLLQRAASEAAALAWVTDYPLLVLPELFHEKANRAEGQARRQLSVRRRSRQLLETVVPA